MTNSSGLDLVYKTLKHSLADQMHDSEGVEIVHLNEDDTEKRKYTEDDTISDHRYLTVIPDLSRSFELGSLSTSLPPTLRDNLGLGCQEIYNGQPILTFRLMADSYYIDENRVRLTREPNDNFLESLDFILQDISYLLGMEEATPLDNIFTVHTHSKTDARFTLDTKLVDRSEEDILKTVTELLNVCELNVMGLKYDSTENTFVFEVSPRESHYLTGRRNILWMEIEQVTFFCPNCQKETAHLDSHLGYCSNCNSLLFRSEYPIKWNTNLDTIRKNTLTAEEYKPDLINTEKATLESIQKTETGTLYELKSTNKEIFVFSPIDSELYFEVNPTEGTLTPREEVIEGLVDGPTNCFFCEKQIQQPDPPVHRSYYVINEADDLQDTDSKAELSYMDPSFCSSCRCSITDPFQNSVTNDSKVMSKIFARQI